MRRFESSRPSQAVRCSEKMPPILAEKPANGGLVRIAYHCSLRTRTTASMKRPTKPEARNLRPSGHDANPEKIPGHPPAIRSPEKVMRLQTGKDHRNRRSAARGNLGRNAFDFSCVRTRQPVAARAIGSWI